MNRRQPSGYKLSLSSSYKMMTIHETFPTEVTPAARLDIASLQILENHAWDMRNNSG